MSHPSWVSSALRRPTTLVLSLLLLAAFAVPASAFGPNVDSNRRLHRVVGVVTLIESGQFTIHTEGGRDISFAVSDATRFARNGVPITYEYLFIGDYVSVAPTRRGFSSRAQHTARVVRVLDDPHGVSVEGTLLSVDLTTRTLLVAHANGWNGEVVVAENARLFREGHLVGLEALVAGDKLDIRFPEVMPAVYPPTTSEVWASPMITPVDAIQGTVDAVDASAYWLTLLLQNSPSTQPIHVQGTASTPVTYQGQEIGWRGIQPGDTVLVHGNWDPLVRPQFNALSVEVVSRPNPQERTEGFIIELYPDRHALLATGVITDQVFEVVLTNTSRILDGNTNQPITFADLTVGDRFEATGVWLPTGMMRFQASLLKVYRQPNLVTAEGVVSMLPPNLSGFIATAPDSTNFGVLVSTGTSITDSTGQRLTLGDIHTGDHFTALGVWSRMPSIYMVDFLVAATVVVDRGPTEVTLSGNIEQILTGLPGFTSTDPNGMEFAVQVTQNTLMTDSNGTPLTLHDLQPGDFFEATGTWVRLSSFYLGQALRASRVIVHQAPPQEMVSGTVVSLFSGRMGFLAEDMNGGQFAVDTTFNTFIHDDQGNVLNLADLQAGDVFDAMGSWNTQTDPSYPSFDATEVIVHRAPAREHIEGTVAGFAATLSGFLADLATGMQVSVSVTSNTFIHDNQGQPLTLQDLQVGDQFEAWGAWHIAPGSNLRGFAAEEVNVFRGQPGGTWTGVISNLSADPNQTGGGSFWLNGENGLTALVRVDPGTTIHMRTIPLAFSDLRDGQTVTVTGTEPPFMPPFSTILASDISVEPPYETSTLQGTVLQVFASDNRFQVDTGTNYMTFVQLLEGGTLTLNGQSATVADLQPGDFFTAEGYYLPLGAPFDVMQAWLVTAYRRNAP